MVTIEYNAEYFDPVQVLECGQIFRFRPFKEGFLVISRDKPCYLYRRENTTYIECEDGKYFYNFFDLDADYAAINQKAYTFNIPVLSRAAELCKGLRLLNQDREETVFSFIISQRNNIPRIKQIIEKLCALLGERREFMGEEYYTFPYAKQIYEADMGVFKEARVGYRDTYLHNTAKSILESGLERLDGLSTPELKEELLKFCGVGEKVANCITLFGFKRTDSFPVDAWVKKLYKEDFCGTLTDTHKICKYFLNMFKDYSGYAQQYLFYAKRENF